MSHNTLRPPTHDFVRGNKDLPWQYRVCLGLINGHLEAVDAVLVNSLVRLLSWRVMRMRTPSALANSAGSAVPAATAACRFFTFRDWTCVLDACILRGQSSVVRARWVKVASQSLRIRAYWSELTSQSSLVEDHVGRAHFLELTRQGRLT